MSPILGTVRPAGIGAGTAHSKSVVEVTLDRHYISKVYTSGSKVTGTVVIQPHQNVKYDEFEILFLGVAATRLDFVQQFTSHSWRPFLKLRMPIEDSHLPESNIFKAGERYTVPFNFVVPHQLTLGACNHTVVSPTVQQQHVRMPPSVGCWESDDMAPEMAQIRYSVQAHALRKIAGEEKPHNVLEGERIIKVLPASPEDAPLDISGRDELYKLSKAKTIRKSLFSPKTGKLSADTAQPGAVMLSADGRDASSSTARINLQFVPDSAETAPPKINSVTAKLQTITYFSGGTVDHLPNYGGRGTYHATPALSYSTTSSLSQKASPESIKWRQENVSAMRRDSGYSSFGDEDAIQSDSSAGATEARRSGKPKTTKKSCPIRHTSSLDINFSLPSSKKKFFLPSFHNCLISRVYVLQLTLSIGPTNTTMTLALPLQIGVDTVHEPLGGELPSFETVMALAEEEEADVFFHPRTVPFPPGLDHHSILPGYEETNRRAIPVA